MKTKNTNRNRVTRKNRKHLLKNKRRRTLKGGEDDPEFIYDPNIITELVTDIITGNEGDDFNKLCNSEALKKFFSTNPELCGRILTGSTSQVSIYRMLYDQNTSFKNKMDALSMNAEGFKQILHSRCDKRQISNSNNEIKDEIVNAILSSIQPSGDLQKSIDQITEQLERSDDPETRKELERKLKVMSDALEDSKTINKNIQQNRESIKKFLDIYFGIIPDEENCSNVKQIVRLIMIINSILRYGGDLKKNKELDLLLKHILVGYGKLIETYTTDNQVSVNNSAFNASTQRNENLPTELEVDQSSNVGNKLSSVGNQSSSPPQETVFGFGNLYNNEEGQYGFGPNQGGGKRRYKKLTKKRRIQKGGVPYPDPYNERKLFLHNDFVNAPLKKSWKYAKENPGKAIGVSIIGLGFPILFTFMGAGAIKLSTYISQVWNNSRADVPIYDNMEYILSQIPSNIRALTYIVFYTLYVFLKSKNIQQENIDMSSHTRSASAGLTYLGYIGTNRVELVDLLTNFNLEKLMPNKNAYKSDDMLELNYDYAFFFLSLKDALFKHSTLLKADDNLNNVVMQILAFCIDRIFLLCKIFFEIFNNKIAKNPSQTITIDMRAIQLLDLPPEKKYFEKINLTDIINSHLIYIDLYNNKKFNVIPIKSLFKSICQMGQTNILSTLQTIFERLIDYDPLKSNILTSFTSVPAPAPPPPPASARPSARPSASQTDPLAPALPPRTGRPPAPPG